MKRITLTRVIVGYLLFVGAGCSNILTATFESDTLGNPPDRTLPGSPSGDAIVYVPALEQQVNVLATPASSDSKSLEYKNVPASSDVPATDLWISFKGMSTNFARPVTFVWSARKDFSPAESHMLIDITDGSGIMAARIRVENNGDVILINDLLSGEGDNIGNIPNNELHTFMITVDLHNENYNVSVIKRSGNLSRNGHALLSDILSFHNPARPAVSFRFEQYLNSQKYIIDEVFINRKN